MKSSKTSQQIALETSIAKLESNLLKLVEDDRNEKKLRDEIFKAANYEKAEASLFDFLVGSWHLFNGVPFINNWHIGCICDHLQALMRGDISDLLINIPPRHAKSSICSVAFPVWAWLIDPSIEFMTASHTVKLSIRDAVKSRHIINSNWFQERWSDKFSLLKDVNQKSKYQNNHNGSRQAGSVGGGDQLGEGYDILIVDDAHKATEAHSKVSRENAIEWWTGTITTRNNSIDSKRMVIMQRLHEDDLSGHILRSGGWTHINLPFYYDPKRIFFSPLGWKDPRTEPNEVLWKVRFPPSEIHKWETELGEYGIASQLQQTPVPLGGGIIKRKWMKFYEITISPSMLPSYQIYGSWDLSFGSTGESYTVGQVWAIGTNNQKYLLNQYRGKWDIIEQISHIRQMIAAYPLRGLLIENKANGDAVMSLLKKELQGSVNLISIEPRDYGGQKELRCIACVPDFESGNVYFPSERIAPWINEYIHELTMFPRGSNDDQVDATTQFLNWWYNKKAVSRAIDYSTDPFQYLKDQESRMSSRPGNYTIKKEGSILTPFSIAASRNIFRD